MKNSIVLYRKEEIPHIPEGLYRTTKSINYGIGLVKHKSISENSEQKFYPANFTSKKVPFDVIVRVTDKHAVIDYYDQDFYLDLVECSMIDLHSLNAANLLSNINNQIEIMNLHYGLTDSENDSKLMSDLIRIAVSAKQCLYDGVNNKFYFYEIKSRTNPFSDKDSVIEMHNKMNDMLSSLKSILRDKNFGDLFSDIKTKSDFDIVDSLYSIRDNYLKTGIFDVINLNQYDLVYAHNRFIAPYSGTGRRLNEILVS